MNRNRTKWAAMVVFLISITAIMSACTSSSDPGISFDQISSPTHEFESGLLTATNSMDPQYPLVKDTSSPTDTPAPAALITDQPPEPSQTATPEPTYAGERPPLPIFQTDRLGLGIEPVAYIEDKCNYMQMRWDPENSEPGTLVIPIMFHSIRARGKEVPETMDIGKDDFETFMDTAHAYDFEAISMTEMIDFVYNNAKIPPRSMLIIVDDRKFSEYYRDHFKPYYDLFGWTIVNAFISHPSNTIELWEENSELEQEGWVDHQAHGVIHNIPIDPSITFYNTASYGGPGTMNADDYIRYEMGGSITAFEEYLNKRPVAYIWPGGGFSKRAVEIGRELGYQIGFTASEYGPVMFNWVTVKESEKSVNDPLMVVPRYWSRYAMYRLDEILDIQEQAKSYAEENKIKEMDWYRTYCGGYPPLAQFEEE